MDWTWSIEELVAEIEAGIWKIVGTTDFSNPEAAAEFSKEIEYLRVESIQ